MGVERVYGFISSVETKNGDRVLIYISRFNLQSASFSSGCNEENRILILIRAISLIKSTEKMFWGEVFNMLFIYRILRYKPNLCFFKRKPG